MADPIEVVVLEASRPTRVRRAAAATRGNDGRLTSGAEIVAIVSLVVQPLGGSALARAVEGDTTTGALAVWSSSTALAAAYLEGDGTETPLGWTTLQLAPPRGAEGPPGDLIEWHGRVFEASQREDWDDDGMIPLARLRRYTATERRAAA